MECSVIGRDLIRLLQDVIKVISYIFLNINTMTILFVVHSDTEWYSWCGSAASQLCLQLCCSDPETTCEHHYIPLSTKSVLFVVLRTTEWHPRCGSAASQSCLQLCCSSTKTTCGRRNMLRHSRTKSTAVLKGIWWWRQDSILLTVWHNLY